jgi:hypothetical protein
MFYFTHVSLLIIARTLAWTQPRLLSQHGRQLRPAPLRPGVLVPGVLRIVMSYPCHGTASCLTIPYFSVDRYTYNGFSIGDSTHDDARLIRESTATNAAFRASRFGTDQVSSSGSPPPVPVNPLTKSRVNQELPSDYPSMVPICAPASVPSGAGLDSLSCASSSNCPGENVM